MISTLNERGWLIDYTPYWHSMHTQLYSLCSADFTFRGLDPSRGLTNHLECYAKPGEEIASLISPQILVIKATLNADSSGDCWSEKADPARFRIPDILPIPSLISGIPFFLSFFFLFSHKAFDDKRSSPQHLLFISMCCVVVLSLCHFPTTCNHTTSY